MDVHRARRGAISNNQFLNKGGGNRGILGTHKFTAVDAQFGVPHEVLHYHICHILTESVLVLVQSMDQIENQLVQRHRAIIRSYQLREFQTMDIFGQISHPQTHLLDHVRMERTLTRQTKENMETTTAKDRLRSDNHTNHKILIRAVTSNPSPVFALIDGTQVHSIFGVQVYLLVGARNQEVLPRREGADTCRVESQSLVSANLASTQLVERQGLVPTPWSGMTLNPCQYSDMSAARNRVVHPHIPTLSTSYASSREGFHERVLFQHRAQEIPCTLEYRLRR